MKYLCMFRRILCAMFGHARERTLDRETCLCRRCWSPLVPRRLLAPTATPALRRRVLG
jgi:hypothetical protein